MEITEIKPAIEALLFATDKPMPIAHIAAVLDGAERKVVHRILDELRVEYDDQGRGFRLAEIAEGWQVVSRPQHAPYLRRLNRTKGIQRLSRAALETLAIIAYKQPLTKSEIENIRGVSSDGVMSNLLERKMVRTVGRKDVVGRPLLYGTTREFLEAFGLKDLGELPQLTELRDLLEQEEDADLFEVDPTGHIREKDLQDFVKGAGEAGADLELDLLAESEAAQMAADKAEAADDSETETGKADDEAADETEGEAEDEVDDDGEEEE